jgi:heme-degrading monooxygenase HmoA
MFRAHDGFGGIYFCADGPTRIVLSFWDDADAVEGLESSALYHDTVKRIEAEGFVLGPSSVERFEIESGPSDA